MRAMVDKRALLALLAVFSGVPAMAQQQLSPAERAQRDADRVFQFIRNQGNKPVLKVVPQTPPPPPQQPAKPVAAAKQPARPADTPAEPPPPLLAQPALAPAAVAAVPEVTLLAAAPMAVPLPDAKALPELPEVELPLRPLSRVDPVIPRLLPDSVRSGQVMVRFTVQPDGSVRQAEAVKASHTRLARSAVEAVLQWRFEPIAQARVATVELGFKLD